MKTVVIFDTNVLLSDPNALFTYADAEIVIPQIVLSELDKIKIARNNKEVRWRGREVSRALFELSEYGQLVDGISLDNNSVVRVAQFESNHFPENLNAKNADDRIIGCALQNMRENPDARVTLVTNDLNMLLKAQTLGIDVKRHENQFQPSIWRKFTGKLGRKRLSLGWLAIPFVLVAILVGLWLFVPSPIPLPANSSAVFETSSYPLKEVEYLNAVKKNPRDFHSWLQLGQLYLDWAEQLQTNGQFEQGREKLQASIQAFKKTLAGDPKNAMIRTSLGTADYYLGNTDDAISQFVQAINYEPNYALAHWNLGFVLANQMNDLDGAARQFEIYLKLEPSGERSDYARQMLQGIRTAQPTNNQ